MNSASTIQCPLCNDVIDKPLYRFHLGSERMVIDRIKTDHPDWSENDGACRRCVDYYQTELLMQQRMLPEIGPYFPVKSMDDFIILPTGLRLDADPKYTGKGITICFIDSGFYSHPDLVSHKNRIKAIVDITNQNSTSNESSAWHGTMTSVVCAGDGYLSNGLYKGIASDAELVLLKVQDADGHISNENITKALQWVLMHHAEYNIRVVNISLGSDEAISYKQSPIDCLAEELIERGIVVVAAAGNDENGEIKAPANSLNVITVGGIDDDNKLEAAKKLYHSSYGQTVDEIRKPELVAHAIWIAAPILPGTKEQKESEKLHSFLNVPENELEGESRNGIVTKIRASKYISPHYMHVDGTSFAAPIVSSVIAQLLEADPNLSPAAIREILFNTAKRIDDLPAERQGFGVIQPRKALLKVLKRNTIMKKHTSPYINSKKKVIEFYVHHDCAEHIALSGSFNHWAHDILQMEPGKNGLWKIQIPMLPAGRYQYKFFVDDRVWLEDVDNPYREPDGFHGFNSILIVENN